jgi:cell division septum initiation protein DivIVA
MTTELSPETTPEFSVTVRGYDRAQVDEYIDWIREWLGNATSRMKAAEGESAQLREQLHRLQERLGDLESERGHESPKSVAALGDRVTRILQLAEEGAAAIRAEILAEAQQTVGKAKMEAEELTRNTQQRQSELEGLLARASEQAQQTVQQAEAKAAEVTKQAEEQANEAHRTLLSEAESRAAAKEAQAEERARDLVKAAEVEQAKHLEQHATQKAQLNSEIQTLTSQRDEIWSGLTKLRETLQSTLGQLPGGNDHNGSVVPPAAEPPRPSPERSTPFDAEAGQSGQSRPTPQSPWQSQAPNPGPGPADPNQPPGQ